MSEYQFVFSDEIRAYLSVRKVELSSESFRHCKRTISLFDKYLFRMNHVEKIIPESVMEGWIKEVSIGVSVNTSSQHVYHITCII